MNDRSLELRKFVIPEVITGEGASLLAKRYVTHFTSRKPLVVTDKVVRRMPWFNDIIEPIKEVVDDIIIFDEVTPNPKDFETMMGAELFLSHECDLVIAIGGGSPMDCAKCICIVSTNGGHILDYEGVDQINLPGPPLICIPTTAGTAADVSQFAIVNDTHSKVKKAIISKKVVPDLALIDPVPLRTMDAYLTACTGMDALTHAIEAYVSNAQSTLTDLQALEAIRLINDNIEAAVKEDPTLHTIYHMMAGSTLAGFAFSNASLGAVHAMAHSMGGLLDLPHGECNSILLEHVIDLNFDAVPERFARIAKEMGLDVQEGNYLRNKRLLIDRIATMRSNIGIPDCVQIDSLTEAQRVNLIQSALDDPCLITNPKEVTDKEIGDIFDRIIQTKKQ